MLRKLAVALIAGTIFTAPVLAQGTGGMATPPTSPQPAKTSSTISKTVHKPAPATKPAVKKAKTHPHAKALKHVSHAKTSKHASRLAQAAAKPRARSTAN